MKQAKTKNGKLCKIYVTGEWAFIPTTNTGPHRSVLYIKVPACVVYVPCHHCGASIGDRCVGTHGPIVGVHVGRKKCYQSRLRHMPDLRIKNCGPVQIK